MKALDRKLLRDLWHLKSQALAISAVVAAGVALFVMSLGNFDSLDATQRQYYQSSRFADVFASLKRAPLRLVDRVREIEGVDRVEARVVVGVTLDVEDMSEPAKGLLVSVPDEGRPQLNDLYLRSGRYLEPGRSDEVLVSEAFAEAHGLSPGDQVGAILNGRRRDLDIVGIALSPEFLYSISAGDLFPDARRFGVFWMARKPLATAFDMEGGFNDLVLGLNGEAPEPEVIAELDRLLLAYGSQGAFPRREQVSNWYLQNELSQLRGMGMMIPTIFLGVAAFLLNVVLTRIVSVQREQIAALKALGYSGARIALHYLEWSLLVSLVGTLLGIAAGVYLSTQMLELYLEYFSFPILSYQMTPTSLLAAVISSLAAASLGAYGAVRSTLRLPPAEAMRPAPPASYRTSLVERLWTRFVGMAPATRMIVRNLLRRPVRTSLAVVGIAFAAAIMVIGGFFFDSMDELLEVQFNLAQRQDVSVNFFEPTSASAYHELGRLPGVLSVEPSRGVAVRLRAGPRSRQIAILGRPAGAVLQRLIDSSYQTVSLPASGLVLSSKLGEVLGVERDDTIEVEVLEGTRPVRRVVVAQLVDEFIGLGAYMEINALHRMLREDRLLSGASLRIDASRAESLYERLKRTPRVAGVALRQATIDNFNTYLADNIGIMIGAFLFFASVIAFGVVYNGARVSLSERSRELASLRVMGFTRAEIATILLGELLLLTLVSIPVGLLLGYLLSSALVSSMDTELYRFPFVILPRTYLWAVATVAFATAVSALIVRRRLDHLDLIGVLKTRE